MRVSARNVREKSSLSLEIEAGKVKVGTNWELSPITREDNDNVTFGKGVRLQMVWDNLSC